MSEDAALKKEKKAPRPAWTYRGARKKAAREGKGQMLKHAPPVVETVADAAYCNRSQNWPVTLSYQQAREMSPSKDPVR